jgi:hypothetical protein
MSCSSIFLAGEEVNAFPFSLGVWISGLKALSRRANGLNGGGGGSSAFGEEGQTSFCSVPLGECEFREIERPPLLAAFLIRLVLA